MENDIVRILKKHLSLHYDVISVNSLKMLFQKSRILTPVCILVFLFCEKPQQTEWGYFKKNFPSLPCIAILGQPTIEMAHYCGMLGIDCVMSATELNLVDEVINRACLKKNSKVDLSEINIDKTLLWYSSLLRDALLIIENDYIKILNTSEISNLIEISESTLSREFSKYDLPSPKKILMSLKVKQAIKLMHNKGLNLQEIALLSGFTDEKRMGECFKRIFGTSPGKYRNSNLIDNL